MIYNYLSEVKTNRELCLKWSRRAMKEAEKTNDPWLRGFQQGIKCANKLQSRWWRELQKDIEALIIATEKLTPSEEALCIMQKFY